MSSFEINKCMTPEKMVSQIEDGMTIGIGGWGARRKPMHLIREIVKSNLKDLTIVSYGGCDVGMLASCLLYTSPSPRDRQKSRMPSSA